MSNIVEDESESEENRVHNKIVKIERILPNLPTFQFIKLVEKGKYPEYKSIIITEGYWQVILYRDYRIVRQNPISSYKEYIKILSNGPSENLIKYYSASDETWKIFIDKGADIRYKKGKALRKAVSEGLNKINILSAENVTKYMYDAKRAIILTSEIISLPYSQFNKAIEIFQSLLDKDQRKYREFSTAYNYSLFVLINTESNLHIEMMKLLIETVPFNDQQIYDALIKSFTQNPDRNVFKKLTPGEKHIIKNELKDPKYLGKLSKFYIK